MQELQSRGPCFRVLSSGLRLRARSSGFPLWLFNGSFSRVLLGFVLSGFYSSFNRVLLGVRLWVFQNRFKRVLLGLAGVWPDSSSVVATMNLLS